MISNTFQTNTFVQGMDCDTDITMLPNQRYRYAENVRVITNDEGTSGVLQGIEGVKKYITTLPSDETVIGTTTINKYAVIVTVKTGGYNKIYRVTDFQNAELTSVVVLKGYLGLCTDLTVTPNISIVANYESDEVIKIYFTDGTSSVKVFNIMDSRYQDASSGLIDSNGDVINTLSLDTTPGSILSPFNFTNMGVGNLPAGMVQYCYQLFNLQGTETVVSPLSPIIHLTASDTNRSTQDYEGSYPNTSSNKSISLSANLITKDFERCRIIRILYVTNNDIPTFTVVDEIEISANQDTIDYTDTGNSFMADITVDEFNSLTSYQFIGTTLAKMQNRLFISDITEDTWDPGDFDARAYRCNSSGTVTLNSSSNSNNLSFSIDSLTSTTVPKEHDCINPYNLKEYSSCSTNEIYAYGITRNGSRVLGGHGINVDYEFVTTSVKLAKESFNNDCSMNVTSEPTLAMSIHAQDNSIIDSIIMQDVKVTNRIPNYADPYIASHFKGYQRDEIYRFGIIFYNNKGIPSPVYWIGDIKTPHAVQMPPFELISNTVYGKPLGIKFTVRNIPDEAVAYEIVRCDRTENDRSVVMQVVGSRIYEYKILENQDYVGRGSELSSSLEMRPTPFFTNFNHDIQVRDRNNGTSDVNYSEQVSNFLRLVSPEICVQKEDIEAYLKDSAYLDCIGSLYSYITNDDDTAQEGSIAVFATANKTMLPDGSTYNWDQKSHVNLDGSTYYIKFPTGTQDHAPEIGYMAGTAKYYNMKYNSTVTTGSEASIQNARYATDIPYNAVGDVSPYRINIGDRTYTNYAMTGFTKNDRQVLMGAAGPCVVAQVNNIENVNIDTLYPPSGVDGLSALSAAYVFNVKRSVVSAYGGNTYVSRQNSVYIPTNSYVRTSASSSYENYTFGGDVFLGMLDYPNMFIFQASDIGAYQRRKAFLASYIPFETSINTNLLNGDMVYKSYASGNFLDAHLQLDIQQTQSYHVQDRPYFVYNAVYSSQQGSKQFVPKSIYAKDNVHTSNRIMVSQAKINNEIQDNWSVFRAADYLDVDNQYGGITNLKVFKDRLFYFQDTAVGIASVNERSLITDENNNQLVLGTGGVLARFDYITTSNGSSIHNDKSITNSDNVLYWYDYDKNEICTYNGQVNILSKEKNVQSYLNEMYDQKRNVNIAFYDKKYNEAWFKFYDKSLIFNEQLGRFTSFYTFNPDWALQFSDKIITIKDNGYYIINTLDTDGLSEVDKTAKIQFVVNKDAMTTKTFDNISIAGEMLDQNGGNITKGLVTSILFNTKHQVATSTQPTFDYRENTYRLPVPRQDTNNEDTSLSYPARMRGKTMVCDYEFDTNNEKTFKIPFITTTYRYSLI